MKLLYQCIRGIWGQMELWQIKFLRRLFGPKSPHNTQETPSCQAEINENLIEFWKTQLTRNEANIHVIGSLIKGQSMMRRKLDRLEE